MLAPAVFFFFLEAFFLPRFFLLVFFLEAFFLEAFFLEDFFLPRFFLDAFFLVIFFLDAFFLVSFFLDAFLRVAFLATVLRFFEVVFFFFAMGNYLAVIMEKHYAPAAKSMHRSAANTGED